MLPTTINAMRRPPFNFVVAVATILSLAAHGLVGLSFHYVKVSTEPGSGGKNASTAKPTQITLLLNVDEADPAFAAIPKPPQTDSPDDLMGEAKGKGTGTHSAKGDQPLQAPEADQDQPFISRDPVGAGKVGDPPTLNTAAPGENGSGGQRGGPQVVMTPAPPQQSPAPQKPPKEVKEPEDEPSVVPKPSPVNGPPPVAAQETPPKEVAPPPSKTASVGASAPDLQKAPADAMKETAPLTQAPMVKQSELKAAPVQGPSVTPIRATGTAPPTSAAPAEHKSVAVAPPLQLPPAPVAAPPPPAAEDTHRKVKEQAPAPAKTPKPPIQIASAAPARVATGDGRAPGQQAPSADPAQESDSESDPFTKHAISAVLRDGKLDVRDGRKVKTTRPHILPGGYVDLFANPNVEVVLEISIDETGTVKHVRVQKSSGFVQVDLPCQRAVYEWWFEPTHDKKGRPMADVVLFTIRFL
jgi:TonB family protein